MKRSAIRLTLILGVITIIGVSVVQIFFLRQALNQEEMHLDQRIQIALTQVSDQLARYNDAEPAYENPIVRIRPDYYVVNVNVFIDEDILEHYLISEFKIRKINLDFEYGIYDCLTDEIVYGNYISLSENPRINADQPNFTKHEEYLYYFGILFPDRNQAVLSNLGLWYFFTGILLLVVIFFVLSQIIILRQKRYSEIQKDFINNLTHEFKTPLSSISMAADVLLEKDDNPDTGRFQRYGKIIKEQSIHLVRQIDNVLHDSAKGQSNFKPKKELTDLKDLVVEVSEQFMPTVLKADGELEIHTPDQGVLVMADKIQIIQVLFNILDNAVKYSGLNPVINIKLESHTNSGTLSISDSGIGIPMEYQTKIFKQFIRVPSGNLHNVKGFGLGLHFVRRVVKAHRWKLKLYSIPAKGTKIDIYFK